MQENIKIDDNFVLTPPSVSQQIKFICRKKKEELKVSNLQISNGIMEKFSIDMPVSTIINFFSDKSKAPSIYTAGYICSYLGISLDEAFKISAPKTPAEIGLQEQIIEQDKKLIFYDERFKDARQVCGRQWIAISALAVCCCALAAVVVYFLLH
jgi:hypothetical protein